MDGNAVQQEPSVIISRHYVMMDLGDPCDESGGPVIELVLASPSLRQDELF
jgi:hypothetical protein